MKKSQFFRCGCSSDFSLFCFEKGELHNIEMLTQDSFRQKTELNQILEILHEIRQKSVDGDYIFRGEPECYEKVSSTLYRKLETAKVLHLNVEDVQRSELEAAKNYTDLTDEFEILVQLQHFDGKTNLIDFTTDYLIALFFAANGSHNKDGRVILEDKSGVIADWVREPKNLDPETRPAEQKSIFVRPPEGFFQPTKQVVIPKSLKHTLLDYLEKEHDISHKQVYRDLHGFISSQDLRWKFYEGLGKSIDSRTRGDMAENTEESGRCYQEAVDYSSKAIQEMPYLSEGYNSRGFAYFCKNDFDDAIDDYTSAIALKILGLPRRIMVVVLFTALKVIINVLLMTQAKQFD